MKGSPDDLFKNRTVIRKSSEIRVFSQTSVCASEARETGMLGNPPSKTSFRTRPKGNHQVNTSLACYFEQIVR